MKFKLVIKIIILVFIIFQLWVAQIISSFPYIGMDLKRINGEWTVIRADVKINSNLKEGDIILEVNGNDPSQFPSVIKWKTLEKADSILAIRDGKEFLVDVRKLNRISLVDIFALSGQILSLFIAIMLWKWVGYSRSAQYLSFLFFDIGATFMSLGASIRGDSIGKTLIGTCLMLVPVILLHFIIVFFKEKGSLNLSHKFLHYMYSIAAFNFILNLIFSSQEYAATYIYKVLYILCVPFFILGVFLNLLVLFYFYINRKKANQDISAILKMVWVSLIISFTPLTFFSFIPKLLFGYYWIDTFYTSWAVLFFPLSFTYLLASKKLYDIDLVIRRFILTTAISIPPSGMIIGIIALLFPTESDASRLAIAFILFVILLSLTLYSFEYLTTKLERVMFPRKYRLQESLKKIAKNLGNISSFRELKDIILVDIISTLQVHGGAILFRYKDSVESISEGEIEAPMVERMAETGWFADPSFTRHEIIQTEEYACYLILTGKKTNTHLGFEETQWLKLIISYLSVSLENIHLIRKLTMKLEQLAAHIPHEGVSSDFAWFRKLMFELQEKERVRISTDLHDTTMQDLFFLKRRCTSLVEKRVWDEESLAQLNGIIEYIDVINMNLRQSCFELHPFLLQEIGLVRTVEKLIDLEAAASPFRIEFRASNVHLIEGCGLETKRHLFRVVQELLNNAKKHSHASRIEIDLSASATRLVLSYVDDGVGFNVNEPPPREIGASRTGVEYMKSRILSMDGHFEFISGKEQGTKFTAALPMKAGRTA